MAQSRRGTSTTNSSGSWTPSKYWFIRQLPVLSTETIDIFTLISVTADQWCHLLDISDPLLGPGQRFHRDLYRNFSESHSSRVRPPGHQLHCHIWGRLHLSDLLLSQRNSILSKGHSLAIRGLAVDPQYEFIYSSGLDQKVCKWNDSNLIWRTTTEVNSDFISSSNAIPAFVLSLLVLLFTAITRSELTLQWVLSSFLVAPYH